MPITASSITPLLQVFDMRRFVAWYCDVLAFQLTPKQEPDGHLHGAMLKLGGDVLMHNSNYEDDKRPAQAPRAPGHADVTLYFMCPNVDEAYEHVRAKIPNVKEPKVTYYGMKQLIISDSDGFDLCFQQRA